MPSEPNFQSSPPADTRELHALLEQLAGSTDEGFRELTERLFASCADQLDAALTPHLLELGDAFLRSDQLSEFYASPDHPLRLLLDLLITQGRTWYARDSKISLQFFEQFVALMEAGKDFFADKNLTALTARMTAFSEWLDAEEKRAAKVEARLCEAEINHLKSLTAECKVVDFINKPLAQNLFPVALIDGIGILKSELLHSLFTTGDDSLLWKSWQRLLPLLGQVFASDVDEQFVYRSVPVMLNELERSQSMGISNADFYRQWIGDLSDSLSLIVRKQPVACMPFAPLPYPEGHSNLNARVTDAVLKQGNSIPQGAWMQFSGENEQLVRCKLALKNPDIDQLLFVDHTGRKVMIKSTKDFSLCLSTGIAKLLGTTHLQDILSLLLKNLNETAALRQAQQEANQAAQQLKMQTVAELQRKLAQQKAAKAKAEEQRQIAAENAARRAAAQKAMAEARTLAEEKARRAAEQALAEERERQRIAEAESVENLQRFQLANIQISSLNLGARVEFLQDGHWVKCKLAVIIAATGKYIFADNLGRKIAELQREQLVQALINRELNLLNNGDSFDDQLAKVIRGLRKDIS